ncbi:hypothetical protein [Formosa sp. A9]|uniref:hypothetical protein n=1 Tax=Formosa sp. A9 TaxID=3442641 RepID=UPI003EBDCA34
MLNIAITIGAILISLALLGLFILKYSYSLDDLDPFSYNNDWDDNLAPEHMPCLPPAPCLHDAEKSDVVICCTVTCETIHTLCDQCGQILNIRTECI